MMWISGHAQSEIIRPDEKCENDDQQSPERGAENWPRHDQLKNAMQAMRQLGKHDARQPKGHRREGDFSQ